MEKNCFGGLGCGKGKQFLGSVPIGTGTEEDFFGKGLGEGYEEDVGGGRRGRVEEKFGFGVVE